MDVFSKTKRSGIMKKIRSHNSKPEIKLRKYLYAMGVRYRLHKKGLPGKPDICIGRIKTAVFVHGCFWHQHGCSRSNMPKTNVAYWKPKLERNKSRDVENIKRIAEFNWKAIVVWECQLKNVDEIKEINNLIKSYSKSMEA